MTKRTATPSQQSTTVIIIVIKHSISKHVSGAGNGAGGPPATNGEDEPERVGGIMLTPGLKSRSVNGAPIIDKSRLRPRHLALYRHRALDTDDPDLTRSSSSRQGSKRQTSPSLHNTHRHNQQ